MHIKEMREKLDLNEELFSRLYNVPKDILEAWETGREIPRQR